MNGITWNSRQKWKFRRSGRPAYLEYRWVLPPDDGVVHALVALVVGAVDGGA